jgi:uncharacterized protein YdaU (DUF1376 family)
MDKKTKTDIWMPVYIGDYLSATNRLTTEQHGAYLLLLMDYWKNGPIPDNNRTLAQITRMDVDAWSNARSILEAFFEVSDGHWKHGRVERELLKAEKRKEVASNRGKAGATARWSKNNASSIAQALPETMLTDGSLPSPSPSKTKQIKSVVKKPDQVSDQVWNDYVKTRQKPLTETALQAIDREAKKAGWTVQQAMEEMVVRGWRGFKADWVAGKNVVEKPVRWNSSVQGIMDKGKELGVVYKQGETIGQYEERIKESMAIGV